MNLAICGLDGEELAGPVLVLEGYSPRGVDRGKSIEGLPAPS